MPEKVNRAAGTAMSAFVAGVTVVKAPFWAIFLGIPLSVASLFSKRAREALADSFDEHIAHPLLHDVPAGLSGEVLNDWEDWRGWSRLRDVLWPQGDPARPADPPPADGKPKQAGPPRWAGVPDLYAALELGRAATVEEIQSAYRRLVKVCHPDVSRSADAQASFIAIDKAYKVLRDPDLRRRYDALTAR